VTPTEILAVRLFGWVPCEAPSGEAHRGYRWYEQFINTGVYNIVGLDDMHIWWGRAHWPDFTDWNWIRRMDEELEKRDLMERYLDTLLAMLDPNYDYKAYQDVAQHCSNVLLCTTDQRIAAALKVLGEVEHATD
jgi:hypothetical protein